MNRVEKAIGSFIVEEDLARSLSKILFELSSHVRMSFQELGEVLAEDPTEVLLAGWEWKLILPVEISKTSAWEDRIFEDSSTSMYEMPNVVEYLVRKAIETGRWDAETAIEEMFADLKVDAPVKLAALVTRLCKKARFHRLTAVEISEECEELALGDRVDSIIAIFKGAGIISPKLAPISEVLRVGSPIYEINPCLCVSGISD